MNITDIKALTHDTIDTNDTTFAPSRMTRGLNKAQDKIVNIILENDPLEQWDDENYEDLAEGFLTITSGQKAYSILDDENLANLLSVCKVFLKPNSASTEYVELRKEGKTYSNQTGIPTAFRISGKMLIFDIIPNYTLAEAIKIMFKRIPKPIEVNDTIREPGIPTTFHHLLALYTAYDYARAKNMANRNDVLAEITIEEKRLGIHVSKEDNNSAITLEAETLDRFDCI